MAKIRVPRTPKKAFDRGRRPSTLLLGQIEHLEWAVLPAAQRKPDQLPARKVKSEAQAAERVAQLTQMLHAAAAADAEAAAARAAGAEPAPKAVAPITLPPLPKTAAPRKRRRAARVRKTAGSSTRVARRRSQGR